MGQITEAEKIIFFIIVSIVIIINFIELVILIRNRKKLTNYECLLLSLSVSDLLVGLSKGPVTLLISIGVITVPTDQELSMLWFSLACSLSHTVAITLDRLVAVAYPIKLRMLSTRKNTMVLLIIVWSFSLLVFPITLTSSNIRIKLCLAILIIITSIVILISYSFIIHKAVIKRRRFFSSSNSNDQTVKMKKNFNLVWMCFIISMTFIAMMLPFSISAIIYDEPPVSFRLPVVANSMINPMLYFFWKFIDRKVTRRQDTLSQGNSTSSSNAVSSQHKRFLTTKNKVTPSQTRQNHTVSNDIASVQTVPNQTKSTVIKPEQ